MATKQRPSSTNTQETTSGNSTEVAQTDFPRSETQVAAGTKAFLYKALLVTSVLLAALFLILLVESSPGVAKDGTTFISMAKGMTQAPVDTMQTLDQHPGFPATAHSIQAVPTKRVEGAVSVVIDAGHGGKDPGTHSRTHASEKDINLAVGTAIAANLRHQGVNVVLTRSSDIFVSLDERVAVSNNRQAKLFVSIHCDSSSITSAKGFSVLIPHSLSEKASSAAQAISRSLESDGIRRHTFRRDARELEVLNGTRSPAVLVEVGFLSNPNEAANLSNRAYQEKLAAAIASGIVDYLRSH